MDVAMTPKQEAPESAAPREIPLTRGLVAKVDASDFEWLSKYKWHAALKRGVSHPYAVRTATKEEREAGVGQAIRMHRQIMFDVGPDKMVDHINGDTLDNRRANLRVCTRGENNRNAQKLRAASSKFKGVSFNKDTGKYRAAICIDGKVTIIGLYPTAMEAALAYDKFAMHIQGEFARLNFPNAAACETIKSLRAEIERMKGTNETAQK